MSAQGTSDDSFLGGRLTIRQPLRGFRSGHEAVLLAASIPADAGAQALEAGIGAGVASLCLLARVPGVHAVGLEAHEEMAALARENAQRNGFADRLEIVAGPVEAPPETVRRRSFDHAFANPPFLETGEGAPAADDMRAFARLGPEGTLAAWIDFCVRRTASGGTVTLLHRADRLERMLDALSGRCGAVHVFPLWPRAGQPARRILLRAVKGARAPMTLLPGLVLHEADGRYGEEAEAVLRAGAPLAALARVS